MDVQLNVVYLRFGPVTGAEDRVGQGGGAGKGLGLGRGLEGARNGVDRGLEGAERGLGRGWEGTGSGIKIFSNMQEYVRIWYHT